MECHFIKEVYEREKNGKRSSLMNDFERSSGGEGIE